MGFRLSKFVLFNRSTADEQVLDEFRQCYLEHRDFVRASVYWMVNSTVVDEIVQEAFLRAWKGFEGFKRDASFKTWIYRIAINTTYDYLRKHRELESTSEHETGGDQDDLELVDLISKALMQLSLEQRESFSLHYQQGYTYQEVAQLLELPEGTIKSRVHSGKRIFIAYLEKNGVKYGG